MHFLLHGGLTVMTMVMAAGLGNASPSHAKKTKEKVVFEFDGSPGEGIPRFVSKGVPIDLHKEPSSKSPIVAIFKEKKGVKIVYTESRCRTLKAGRVKAIAPASLKGYNLGNISFLAKGVHPKETDRETLSFKEGDSFEYLQYASEGGCFIRVKDKVILTDPVECNWLANFGKPSKSFAMVEPGVTEWWVSTPGSGKRKGGWLLVDEKKVGFLPREF
jgi:hypothetical protein